MMAPKILRNIYVGCREQEFMAIYQRGATEPVAFLGREWFIAGYQAQVDHGRMYLRFDLIESQGVENGGNITVTWNGSGRMEWTKMGEGARGCGAAILKRLACR